MSAQQVMFTVTATNNWPSQRHECQVHGCSAHRLLTLCLRSTQLVRHTIRSAACGRSGPLTNGGDGALCTADTATVLASGNYTNTATRTASTPADPNAANDSAIASS